MLHAAIYDAVNAIDQTHEWYAVRFSGVSRRASQGAAADAAAHDVLVALYPALASTLDATLQQSLTLVPDGVAKTRRHPYRADCCGSHLVASEQRWREPGAASLRVRERAGRLSVDASRISRRNRSSRIGGT